MGELKRSTKVVMVTHGYYPRIGGAERQVASVSSVLQARGFGVQVITRRFPGTLAYEEIDGVPVHRLPAPGPKPVASLLFTLAALQRISALQPDIIHAHELISPATIALLAKCLYRKPIVVTVHGGGVPSEVMRLSSRPFGKLRLKVLLAAIDFIIVLSHDIDAELAAQGVPSHKRVAIPNGVDTSRFFPLGRADQRVLRSKLGLPVDAPLAIFTGRLVPNKRVNMLVEIWPEVLSVLPDARLLIVGSGPEEEYLRQLVCEGVCWLGAQQNVAPYLQAADLFVLPSVAEGLSVALLEAMACGLACIATQVGGAPDLIAHQQNGWLIPADDRSVLKDALLALLADENRRRDLGQNARQQIMKSYTLDSVADRLSALYGTMLD
jgi:glycosyltransferase involved in cell wall biosynthesis